MDNPLKPKMKRFLGIVGILMVLSFAPQVLWGIPLQSEDNAVDKNGLLTKASNVQIPFIANEGQMDSGVGFYAKTFGGTVFVTKDGEIVYLLTEGRGQETEGTKDRRQRTERRK